MKFELTGSTSGIKLGPKYTIFAPGFTGSVNVYDAEDPRTRGIVPKFFPEELERVLTEENMIQLHTISAQLDRGPRRVRQSRLRSPDGEESIVLDMNNLGEEVGQVILATDESGVVTWHFPQKSSPPGKKRFIIRSPQVEMPEDADTQKRMLFKIARKILKTFIYKITDPIIGLISEKAVETWEGKKRPYGLIPFTPDTYKMAGVDSLDNSGLRQLAGGPALLFLHGTFSTAYNGFREIPQDTMKTLYNRYNGRVFAFNHHTLSHDPIQNVEWFLKHIPNDIQLNLDILSHSRGGLLARTLAGDHPGKRINPDRIKVNRIVFAGTPNRGTILCDPDHIPDFLDRYTTMINLLSSGPIGEILDAVITVVKILGHGILKGLDGLASMDPNGKFISNLNRKLIEPTRCFGLTANYDPVDPGLIAFLKNKAVDKVFGEKENDLVVPTKGVEPPDEPLTDSHRYVASEAVHHNDYFSQPDTQSHLLEWLTP